MRRGPADKADRRAGRTSGRVPRLIFRTLRWGVCGSALLLLAGGALEAQTSFFQSRYFTRTAHALSYSVRDGASSELRYPTGGPQDKRLGYSQLESYVHGLTARNFSVAHQASWSPELEKFAQD